jgi:cytochrome c
MEGMNMLRVLLVCIALISVLSNHVLFAVETGNENPIKAEENIEAARAKTLLTKAVNYYMAKKDQALATFSRQGEFVDGQLYVFVIGTDGKLLASGGSSSVFIGRDVSTKRDVTGKLFIREVMNNAKANSVGTVEYRWLNWEDRKIERKVAYYQKVADRIIIVGYYIPRASKAEADALLQEAVNAVAHDSNSALSKFNDMNGGFVKDDLYVFVIDLNDKIFRAHGVNPRLIGTNAMDLKDTNGKPFITKEIVTISKQKGKGSIEYKWRNPVTEKIETKHTSFRKVNNLIVAVGYFTR